MTRATLAVNAAETALGSAAPDFDRLAHVYRWMEWLTFGPFLQRCRCAFLRSLGRRRRALVLGDGDGRFTARLVQSDPAIEVDAVDASEAMLLQLANRSRSNRVRTHVADVRAFTPAQRSYDLIATHFLLDCLTSCEVSALASQLCRHSSPDAIWVVSEFAIPPNLYGRTIAAPLIRGLYLAFGMLTNMAVRQLPDHRAALARSGWHLVRQRRLLGGLLASEIWSKSPHPFVPA